MAQQRMILNAFDMTCVSHQAAGTWRHPDSQAWRYKDLEYWTDLAKVLERGRFDAIFIADVVGVYDVYRGSVETSLVDADQVPVNDPFFQVPAMAMVTEHLGFGVTSALTYELPYALARKFATLDHLTKVFPNLLLAIAPVIIFFIYMQRHIISGLTVGATKG